MKFNKDQTAEPVVPRSAYVEHPHVYMEITGVSLAKQSMRAECDINNIMAAYVKTGLLPHVNKYQGNYTDLPSSVDFHEALNQAIAAKEAFDTLPADIRTQFHNDPEEFLAFVEDPENIDEMIDLGLAKPQPVSPDPETAPQPPTPPEVAATPPAAPAAPAAVQGAPAPAPQLPT